jgi:hypothetical protein
MSHDFCETLADEVFGMSDPVFADDDLDLHEVIAEKRFTTTRNRSVTTAKGFSTSPNAPLHLGDTASGLPWYADEVGKRAVLTAIGWFLAVAAVGAIAWDVISPDTPGGSAAAQAGFRVGTVIGIVLRTVLLGGGAAVLLRLARSPGRDRADGTEVAMAHRRAPHTSVARL